MKSLKLVGIQGAQKYEDWKTNTLQALKVLQIQIALEEINNLDHILTLNLSAIPALLINNSIILEREDSVPDSDEIGRYILQHIVAKNLRLPAIR